MQQPPEKLVFSHAVESVFTRGLGARLSSAALARLRGLGLDPAKILPAYPFETWMAALRIAAEDLYPNEALEAAMFRLGEELVDGYRETVLGSAVLSMARVLGPKRTLARAAQSFRSGNNYTETKLTELGPGSYDLWMNEVGPYPTFTAGIIAAGLRASGAADGKAEVRKHDGHACTYRVSWRVTSG